MLTRLLLKLRSAVMRGIPLPKWLRDSAQFGEQGIELELDRCLVRVAQLRHDYLAWKALAVAGANPSVIHTRRLVHTAHAIDHQLVMWSISLSQDYLYEIQHVPGFPPRESDTGHDGADSKKTRHIYTSLTHANHWNNFEPPA